MKVDLELDGQDRSVASGAVRPDDGKVVPDVRGVSDPSETLLLRCCRAWIAVCFLLFRPPIYEVYPAVSLPFPELDISRMVIGQ